MTDQENIQKGFAMTYTPQPIDTQKIVLEECITQLSEMLAKNAHENWSMQRMHEGWTYGPQRNDTLKHNPCLVPYEDLSDSEKEYDRIVALETLKTICALGYRIVKE